MCPTYISLFIVYVSDKKLDFLVVSSAKYKTASDIHDTGLVLKLISNTIKFSHQYKHLK